MSDRHSAVVVGVIGVLVLLVLKAWLSACMMAVATVVIECLKDEE